MNKTTMREAFRIVGSQGGKIAAKRMTKAQRIARAKKAAAASAKVRSAKARKRANARRKKAAKVSATDAPPRGKR